MGIGGHGRKEGRAATHLMGSFVSETKASLCTCIHDPRADKSNPSVCVLPAEGKELRCANYVQEPRPKAGEEHFTYVYATVGGTFFAHLL